MNLDEFLKVFPWDKRGFTVGSSLDSLWEFELDVRVTELWEHLVDTSRFNRALGLSKMEYEEIDGRLHGSTVNAGFEQAWIEEPWQWIEGRSVIGGRVYSKGFARSVRVIYDLSSLDAGTKTCLRVYMGWIKGSWWGAKILKSSLPWLKKRYTEVLGSICRDIQSDRPAVYEQKLEALDEAVESRIRDFSDMMMERRLPSDAVRCLLNFVRTADDMDAYRLRVHQLSRRAGVDENALLGVCLHATRLGLLRMSWDVICPHCRGVLETHYSLSTVTTRGSCEPCAIKFATDEENALEITFQIHPSIRNVPRVFYCAAVPAGQRHIKLQQTVEPSGSVIVEPVLAPGRYRLRIFGEQRYRFLDVEANCEPEAVEWDGSVEGLVLVRRGFVSELKVGEGSSFKLINGEDTERTYIIEDVGWSDLALRPGTLFNRHEFRDLFSEEFLDSGVGISVGNQVLLFTDVVGSTRFYAECGDPKAYTEIRAHFDEISAIVSRHDGAVVKTIGDAVMASFSDPVCALKASTEMHQCFHENRKNMSIGIRISLNMGPCIAVALNTNIDYFGTAVNVAAKLQAFAEAGDVAFSESIWQVPGVQDYVQEQGIELEGALFESSAFKEPIPVHRWNVYKHGGSRSGSGE